MFLGRNKKRQKNKNATMSDSEKIPEKVIHFDGKAFSEETVELIKEEPFTIYLNDEEFITLLCHPDNLDELAVGFLKSEGLINERRDIKKLNISKDLKSARIKAEIPPLAKKLHEKRIVTTGCGKGSIFYFAIDSIKCNTTEIKKRWHYNEILTKMREINQTRGTKKISGLHVCGLYDGENFIIREDIGRHNALDKIIGYCLINDIHIDDDIIFTTGRISSEILLKAAKVNAGVIVSRSTPTALAYEIAKKLNITLLGYVRGMQMTIYTAKDRIKIY